MKKTIKKIIAPAYYKLLDVRDSILYPRLLLPPHGIRFVGNSDFVKTGEIFLNHFIEQGGLKKSDAVLDAGCGIGRMAIPMLEYLDQNARYEGFDVGRKGIEWCQQNITPKYPNFRFEVADLFNKLYNPGGKYKASEYKFPYKGTSFDFVFLTSVFTHMLPDEVENYLSEISRVLREGGKCFATFFILNEVSEKLMKEPESTFSFKNDKGIYRIENEDVPEDAVAYKEEYLKKLFHKHSLQIEEPIHYGRWCNRKEFLSFQDIVILKKNSDTKK